MLSVFVCMSWSVMTSWHTYTRSHVPLKRLHIWRLSPTAEAYMKMDSWYRPTQIQLSIPHPSIIDWMPWPAMRDKLILYHAANPHLDNIVVRTPKTDHQSIPCLVVLLVGDSFPEYMPDSINACQNSGRFQESDVFFTFLERCMSFANS
jgi:hypothetical protein